MELWKSVIGYEGMYEVSNTGNVRSVDRRVSTNIKFNTSRVIKGKPLDMNLKHTGYYSVDLCKNGKVKTESVHRLVAIAFIPNPNNSKVVNHINGIKTDNRVENLEWVSYKDNHWHARKNNLLVNIGQHNSKRLLCIETNTVFENSVRAAEWLLSSQNSNIRTTNPNVIAKNIRGAVTGRTPKAYGYHWKDV